jgi:hypothetical protein
MQTTPATDAAANVRRSVTRQVERIAREMVQPAAFTEALTVAKHLREGDPQSAIKAHGVIRRRILADLREIGCAEECFVSLVNALHDYLTTEGHEWEGGRWRTEASAAVARGVRVMQTW